VEVIFVALPKNTNQIMRKKSKLKAQKPFYILNLLLITAIVMMISSCGAARHVASVPLEQNYMADNPPEKITESLFQVKDRTLTEEAIQKLLDGRVELPEKVRVAVFAYNIHSNNNHYRYYWNNEEYLKLQQSYMDEITAQLKQSSRVEKVLIMPKMMATNKSGLTHLREASVRLQADVLLILSVKSDIYHKYKVFKKDRVKAFATCEGLLMDIRTGMIPFSDVLNSDNEMVKEKKDWSIETVRKQAENNAVLSVLSNVGKNIASFLEKE